MKNTTKWTTMAAVLALSTSLAIAAPNGAKGEGKHARDGRGMHGERFEQKLNLTDAQKEQIRTIRASFREQNKAFFETAQATREQFRDAKKSGDTARADALKATMEAHRTQMQHIRQQQRAQIAAILTPEQRTQFEELEAKRAAHHQKMGDRGMHGKHGRHGRHDQQK